MFSKRRNILVVLAGSLLLASLAGCATTITFETLQPAPIDVEDFKSVALIPFTVKMPMTYNTGKIDYTANMFITGISADPARIQQELAAKGKQVLPGTGADPFSQELLSQFNKKFQESLLAEELFIVIPDADVAKAQKELGESASPLDIAKKLNVAAYYTGELEVFVTDHITTTQGLAWKYNEAVKKIVQKVIENKETGAKSVVDEEVTEQQVRFWCADAMPPKNIKAEIDSSGYVLAAEREIVFNATYKLIQTSTGKVLSSRTFTSSAPKTTPVIIYDSCADKDSYAFKTQKGKDTLSFGSDKILKLAQNSYRWFTNELRPSTVQVTRELMVDQSKDSKQGKELDSYIKLTTENKFDEAEKGFVTLWGTSKNIAAAVNASMLMERRKDYVTALKLMDELVAAQPSENLQKQRNLLKSAANTYLKAMEQKKKIDNNAIKIQRILDEKGYKVKVVVADTGIKLILDDIKFKPDSAEYEKTEEAKLQKLGAIVEIFPQYDVLLIGHAANPKGAAQDEEAMVLSKNRAQAIANFFIKNKIRTTDNVFAVGKGITEPIADNTTEEGRAKNRRIEMTFVIN